MPTLHALVEGDGEQLAAPRLLSRALLHLERHEWYVGDHKPRKVGSVSAFQKRVSDHAEYLRRLSPDAVLVLLDLDDGCPMEEGPRLAASLRTFDLPFPVAVVLAHREYEAWFLASLPSIAAGDNSLPTDASYEADPESPRDCKKPLTALMPRGQSYRETAHQAPFTSAIDFEMAAARSRSFRRLLHAIDQVTAAESSVVTP